MSYETLTRFRDRAYNLGYAVGKRQGPRDEHSWDHPVNQEAYELGYTDGLGDYFAEYDDTLRAKITAGDGLAEALSKIQETLAYPGGV